MKVWTTKRPSTATAPTAPAVDAFEDADLWVPAIQTRAEVLDFHHFSTAHADATIALLDLDSVGSVPWWQPERRAVTLHQILVHLVAETARHAGHADIVRELIDGSIGNGAADPNTPPAPRTRGRLTALASRRLSAPPPPDQ